MFYGTGRYWHNTLWRGNTSDLFHSAWINSSAAWETLAYTSIIPAGIDSESGETASYIVYQKYSGPKWGESSESFMMKVLTRQLLDDQPRMRYQPTPYS